MATEPAWWEEAEQRFKAAGLLDEEAEAAYQSTVLKELRAADVRQVDDLPEEAYDRLLKTKLRLWPAARDFYGSLNEGVAESRRAGTEDIGPSAKHLYAETPNEMRGFIFSTGRAEERAEAERSSE